MNHITIGFYSDDSYKINIVKAEDFIAHIEYNKVFRCGRALFVDGKCENQGYLSDTKVREWEAKIKHMDIDKRVVTYPYI